MGSLRLAKEPNDASKNFKGRNTSNNIKKRMQITNDQ